MYSSKNKDFRLWKMLGNEEVPFLKRDDPSLSGASCESSGEKTNFTRLIISKHWNTGWFQRFFMFIMFITIWGRFPFWLIFSMGLKPPTRTQLSFYFKRLWLHCPEGTHKSPTVWHKREDDVPLPRWDMWSFSGGSIKWMLLFMFQ